MKKKYHKPTLVIEHFELSESIASGCTTIVDFDFMTCYDLEGGGAGIGESGKLPAQFDGDACDCYHTAANETPSTSA